VKLASTYLESTEPHGANTSGMGVVVLRRFCSRFVYEAAKRLQNDYKTTTPYVVVLYMKRCFLRRFKSYTLNDAKRLLLKLKIFENVYTFFLSFLKWFLMRRNVYVMYMKCNIFIIIQ
jgi:hypothetical protein